MSIVRLNHVYRSFLQLSQRSTIYSRCFSTDNSLIKGDTGCGKTYYLVSKAVELINKHNVHPSDIIYLCTSQVAAQKIVTQINGNTRFTPYDNCIVSTVERFATHLLRDVTELNSLSYKIQDSRTILSRILDSNHLEDSLKYPISLIRFFHSLHQNDITSDELISIVNHNHNSNVPVEYKEIFDLYSSYIQLIEGEHIIPTPHSCISLLVKLLDSYKLPDFKEKFIFWDDYQLFGIPHLKLMQKISSNNRNLSWIIAGDDSQCFGKSFFSTLTSDKIISELLEPTGKPFDIIEMNTQQRSSSAIVMLHNSILEKKKISEEFLNSYPNEISLVCYKDQDKGLSNSIYKLLGKGVEQEEFLILVRTNNRVQQICSQLGSSGLHVQNNGCRLFDKPFAKLLVSYLYVLINDKNPKIYWDLLSYPSPFALSTKTLDILVNHCINKKKILLEQKLCNLDNISDKERNRISDFFAYLTSGRNMIRDGASALELLDHFKEKLELEKFWLSNSTSNTEYLNHTRLVKIIRRLENQGKSLHHTIDELHKIRCSNEDKIVRFEDAFSEGIRVMTVHRARLENVECSHIFLPDFCNYNYPSSDFSSGLKKIIPNELLQIHQSEEIDEINVLSSAISRAKKFVQFSFDITQTPSKWLPENIVKEIIKNPIDTLNHQKEYNDESDNTSSLFEVEPIRYYSKIESSTGYHPPFQSYHTIKGILKCELKYAWQRLYTGKLNKKPAKTLPLNFSHLGILLRLSFPTKFSSSFWQDNNPLEISMVMKHISQSFEDLEISNLSAEQQLDTIINEILKNGSKEEMIHPLSSMTLQFSDGDITVRGEDTSSKNLAKEAILMKEKLSDYGIRSSRFQVELYLYLIEKIFGVSPIKEISITTYQPDKTISITPSVKLFQKTNHLVERINSLVNDKEYNAMPDELVCKSCKFSITCPSSQHSIEKKE